MKNLFYLQTCLHVYMPCRYLYQQHIIEILFLSDIGFNEILSPFCLLNHCLYGFGRSYDPKAIRERYKLRTNISNCIQ